MTDDGGPARADDVSQAGDGSIGPDPAPRVDLKELARLLGLSQTTVSRALNGCPEVSEATRARVEAGVTTAWHLLRGIGERYLIISGVGQVEVGDMPPTRVGPGDVVRIPPDVRQRISNNGETDLIFYAICTPRFTESAYVDLEQDGIQPR